MTYRALYALIRPRICGAAPPQVSAAFANQSFGATASLGKHANYRAGLPKVLHYYVDTSTAGGKTLQLAVQGC